MILKEHLFLGYSYFKKSEKDSNLDIKYENNLLISEIAP